MHQKKGKRKFGSRSGAKMPSNLGFLLEKQRKRCINLIRKMCKFEKCTADKEDVSAKDIYVRKRSSGTFFDFTRRYKMSEKDSKLIN